MWKNALILALLAAIVWLRINTPSQPQTSSPEPTPPPSPDTPPPVFSFPQFHTTLSTLQDDPALAPLILGFCLLDENAKPLLTHQPDLGLIPASTLKTLTAATALEHFGPEHRIQTQLLAEGPFDPATGKLHGNLILKGGGDPTLTRADLDRLASQLLAQGLTHLTGSVCGDNSLFSGEMVGDFWGWGDVGNGYGSPVCALNLGHNRFLAHFDTTLPPGTPAPLRRIEPELPGVTWENHVTLALTGAGDQVTIYGGPWSPTLRLRGTLGHHHSRGLSGAVPNPPLLAATTLHQLLEGKGVSIAQPPRALFSPPTRPTRHLLTHSSHPLLSIVTHLMATSDNLETECLLRLLALDTGQPAAELLRTHWQRRGLDLHTTRLVDGSGLSRANFVSARQLATLQALASTGPYGTLYRDTLTPHFDGQMRWKIGAMSRVRGHTGLIELNTSQKRYFFALLGNHYLDEAAFSRACQRLFSALLTDLHSFP